SHIVPAVNRRIEGLLDRSTHIHDASTAWSQQPLVRIGSEHIHMLQRRWECPNGLNGIQAKQDLPFLEVFANRIDIYPIPADEMAGGKGHQPGVFINLTRNILRSNLAQAACVHQTDLNPLFSKCHPGIYIRRVIVEIDENVVSFSKLKSAGKKA